MGLWFTLEYPVETSRMPVDIAKAYFEVQRLRREVRKAERALKVSFARLANRARLPGRKLRDARSASLLLLEGAAIKREAI